jgi:protein polybromo-1
LRCDFCRSQLLACETRTESDAQKEDEEIGILYYKIVSSPVDLNTIRDHVDAGKYGTMHEMEKDLIKLFNNARKFDAHVNVPEDRFVTQDADALQAVMARRIKEVAERTRKLVGAATKSGSQEKKPAPKRPAAAAASTVKTEQNTQRRIASAFRAVIDCQDGRRKRSELFMELPDREEYPDYYELIAEPTDLNAIREQVQSGAFKSWETFEAAMMRVFSNAKQYNLEGSQVYEDAHVMQSLLQTASRQTDGEGGGTEEKKKERPAKKRRSAGPSPSERHREQRETTHELQARIAASFQQVVNCKDGRRKRAAIFMELPDREEWSDYYEVIKAPIALNTIGERVKAGKYRKWELFEAEMGRAFSNAKQYNDPNSQVYEDAEVMQSLLQQLAGE